MEGEGTPPAQRPNPAYWTRFWAIKSARVRREIIARLKRYEQACIRAQVPEHLRDYNTALFELLEEDASGSRRHYAPLLANRDWQTVCRDLKIMPEGAVAWRDSVARLCLVVDICAHDPTRRDSHPHRSASVAAGAGQAGLPAHRCHAGHR